MNDRAGSPQKQKRGGGEGENPNATAEWAARGSGDAGDGEKRSRGGRPRGSRDKRPRKRRGDQAPGEPLDLETTPADGAPPEAEAPSELEIRIVGKLGGAIWKMLARRFNRRELTGDEQNELAEAAIPVMNKYLGGLFEQFGPEATLVIVVVALWDGTELPPQAKTESSAAALEDAA